MQFSRIEDKYLYGYTATAGRYKVEIIRVCAGRWQLFYSVGRYPFMPTYGLNHTFPFQTAQKIAREWLKGKGARHA